MAQPIGQPGVVEMVRVARRHLQAVCQIRLSFMVSVAKCAVASEARCFSSRRDTMVSKVRWILRKLAKPGVGVDLAAAATAVVSLAFVRVALISDLHGNMVALRAVIEHIERSSVDRIVCLGDVATLGPAPQRVVETLADLGCPCILGNHDEFVLNPELIHSYTEIPVVVDSVDACRASLGSSEVNFLRTFQPTLEIDMDGATLSLFHGSPRSHMEDLLATTPAEQIDQALGAHRAAVMAGGHTHIQMLRQHRGTLLVNPGSLGLPFETFAAGGPPTILPHAEYAAIDAAAGSVAVTLHRVPLDQAALITQAKGWDNPLRDYLVSQYERWPP